MTDPALIYRHGDPAAPGAHVIVIGVGLYDHLIDGPEENLETAEGMEQLGSPPRSARQIADWWMGGGYRNEATPLASLAVVLSEPEGGAYPAHANIADHPLPRGAVGDVEGAVEAWAERAAAHPDNLAVFYFSGHGVSTAEPLLLCRDYGRTTGNPYRGAINFSGLRGALATRAPKRQLFLIDACRLPASVENALMGQTGLGNPVLSPQDRVQAGRDLAAQSVHFAASAMSAAYGRAGGVTYFTSALIEALDGGGALSNLDWSVSTDGLQTALVSYVAQAAEAEALRQMPTRADQASFVIHKPEAIQVPLAVTCDPETVWSRAMRLEARSQTGEHRLEHDPAEPRRVWRPVLPKAAYAVSAEVDGARAALEPEVLVVPPSAVCRLKFGGRR